MPLVCNLCCVVEEEEEEGEEKAGEERKKEKEMHKHLWCIAWDFISLFALRLY